MINRYVKAYGNKYLNLNVKPKLFILTFSEK